MRQRVEAMTLFVQEPAPLSVEDWSGSPLRGGDWPDVDKNPSWQNIWSKGRHDAMDGTGS